MPGAGAMPPPDELRSVAGYRLLRQVGEGGMSTVFLSYDVAAGRPVAVKVLADHLAERREFVERFYREARNGQRLHHPNLVRGHAAGFDPDTGKHYLVMEYVDGPSAHTALARVGRLPVGVAVRVGVDVATALAHLHARDYVHRDVKPDNILLPPGGPAKLADLGLTKQLSGDGHLTAVSEGVGTTYYMPYEQAMNAALVDGRSDIYALGATLYHLLTGHVPFPGSSHEEVIRGKEQGTYRPVRAAAADVPPVLGAIITRALSRDPRERFQDAAAFAAALESTGLAADIPAFPAEPGGRPPGDQPPDAPTRADLPAYLVVA
ncbi:MAG: serine/threonine protein kinase, partial [Gemmataceae bacterium]|nr:serine/threonine protein kinase [Gemmataceae bacterium]